MILNRLLILYALALIGSPLKAMEHKKKKHTYLQSKPFKERLEMAATWVTGCDCVIEIGGARNPISNYIKGIPITVIDPEIRTSERGLVTHIAKRFEHWQEPESIKTQKYAVVIMGLELYMQDNGWQKLYDLINRSDRTIIEYSVQYKVAKRQVKAIVKSVDKEVTNHHEWDLSAHDFSKFAVVHPLRRMICLETAPK